MGDPENVIDLAKLKADAVADQKRRRAAMMARIEAAGYGTPKSNDEPKAKAEKPKPQINVDEIGFDFSERVKDEEPKVKSDEEPKADEKAEGGKSEEAKDEQAHDEKLANEDEEAVRSEEPSAVKALGIAEATRRFTIRKLKLVEINGKYAVIRSYGGKCVVVTDGRSPINPNKKVFLIQGREAFEQWNANDFIPSLKKLNESEPVGPWWWRHPKRRQFAGLVFAPLRPRIIKVSGEHELFNTYLGWGVEPKQGDWSLIRRHIREVLADGDPKTEDYIVRWTAWNIQHPDKMPLVALVLIGFKGRGKGTFARVLERIFGDHSLQISSQRHIVGNFNAHLEDLILLISDEAYWAGHKADAGTLQRMITEPTLTIERKGYDVRNVKNHIRLLMLAEPGWSVPAGQDERRYAVYDVRAEVGNEDYFNALYREIEGDGPAAMLYDLQRIDLGSWHPRQVYKTGALRRQQDMNLGLSEEWLLTLLVDGCLPSPPVGKWWMSSPTNLINDAKYKVPKLRDLSFNALATFLESWGCTKSGGDVRYWHFPPLAEMRDAWNKKYTPREWSAIADWGFAPRTTLEDILAEPLS
jgi:hypothetical protein